MRPKTWSGRRLGRVLPALALAAACGGTAPTTPTPTPTPAVPIAIINGILIDGTGATPAARVCALERDLGTLVAGRIADVLVVDGDPLSDLAALTQVRLVVHDGVIIRGGS